MIRNVSNVEETREKFISISLKQNVMRAQKCITHYVLNLRYKILTLGVGRSLAGFLEARLLAFLDAGVAGEQTTFA